MSNENIKNLPIENITNKNTIIFGIHVVRRLIVPRLYKIIKIIVIHLQTEMYV